MWGGGRLSFPFLAAEDPQGTLSAVQGTYCRSAQYNVSKFLRNPDHVLYVRSDGVRGAASAGSPAEPP
jgi:hypothetical protein